MKKLEPFGDYVLLTRAEAPEEIGGIKLPESVRDSSAPSEGTVEAVGPMCVDVKIGDYVLFNTFSGSVVKVNDREFYLMKSEELVGRLVSADKLVAVA